MSKISVMNAGGGSSGSGTDPNAVHYVATLDFYIATTGNDITGDGSVGNPWATIQHAVDECKKYVWAVDSATLHIADGTYTENVEITDFPYLIVIEGNTTTTNNVIVQASNASTPVFDVNNAFVDIDGMKIQNSTSDSGIKIDEGSVVNLFSVNFFNNKFGIYVLNGSTVFLLSGDTVTIDGNNIANGDGILMSRKALLVNAQSITITNVYNGIGLTAGSTANFSTGTTTNITQSSVLGTKLACIFAREFSYLRMSGTFNLDGFVADTSNYGIELLNSEMQIASGSTLNFSNLTTGWNLFGQSYIQAVSSNYNYTLVGTEMKSDYSVVIDSTNAMFSVAPWRELNELYGYDARYLKLTGGTISPTTTGIILDIALETEWTAGTIINADYASATTLTGDISGINLDFSTNLTPLADADIIGYEVEFPNFTQSTTDSTFYIGYYIHDVFSLTQNTLAGTITWYGAYFQMPNITQTTGSVNSYGLRIVSGTVTSGTAWGIYVDGDNSYFGGTNTFRKGVIHEPTITGTLYDFRLETEWTTGTLINADFGSPTTLSGNIIGVKLDLQSNVTATNKALLAGFVVDTPDTINTGAGTYLSYGLTIAGGALTQNTLAGTSTWFGVEITMPDPIQTTGTVASYGISITGGNITSGIQRLINGTITQTVTNESAVNITTTIGADVGGINGISSALVGYSAGGAADATYTAYVAALFGNANDTAVNYDAFSALDALKNGGTSQMTGFFVGTGYDHALAAFSGDISFYNYNPTIEVVTDSGVGNTLTIKSGDGVGGDSDGGDIIFDTGSSSGAGERGSYSFKTAGTEVVSISKLGKITITPWTSDFALLDFNVNSGFVNGRLINGDFSNATTLNDPLTGVYFDFETNLTATGFGVYGTYIKMPAVTNVGAGNYDYFGHYVSSGAIEQNTLAGITEFDGIRIQLPDITQTTGEVRTFGLNIIGGTINSGTQGLIHGTITQTQADTSSVQIVTTLGADVDNVIGISSVMLPLSTGSTKATIAYIAQLTGDDNDNDAIYIAYGAIDFDGVGGTSTAIGCYVGTGYDAAMVSNSGDIVFTDYDVAIRVETETGVGKSLTIRAGSSGGGDNDGGYLNLVYGFETGTGTEASINMQKDDGGGAATDFLNFSTDPDSGGGKIYVPASDASTAGNRILLTSGDATGPGNHDGGDIVLTPGLPNGTGRRGAVYIPRVESATVGTPEVDSRPLVFESAGWDTDGAVEVITLAVLSSGGWDGNTVRPSFRVSLQSDEGDYGTFVVGPVDDTENIFVAGDIADGATAIGITIGANLTLSTSGAKLVSVANSLASTADEKAYIDIDGSFYSDGRKLGTQGSDVTAANDITLGLGNYFDITGATEVQRILGTGWTDGSLVVLQFDSNPNVKTGVTAGSSYYGFKLAGAVDFAATAGDTLTLVFDGGWWRELARSAN
jgi:hypothetical protein